MSTPMTTGPGATPRSPGEHTCECGHRRREHPHGAICQVQGCRCFVYRHADPPPMTMTTSGTRQVWRFPAQITDRQSLCMPGYPTMLHVAPSRLSGVHGIDVWALVDPEAPERDHEILIVGTGYPVPEDAGRHIGSCITHGGAGVWHVFEVLP